MIKFLQSLKTYWRYFSDAILEIYIYYSSPFVFLVFMKKWSLANRKLRIIWTPKLNGRKPLDQETIDLIIEMKKMNPTWGAKRISDELNKIGYKSCKKTVLKYLEIYGLNNPSPHGGLSWKEFLNNHKFKIGIDFTSLISLFGHQLYIFVIVNLDTRELVFITVTSHPCAEWLTQQFRNAFMDTDQYPSLCICDRDQIFSHWFAEMMRSYFETKAVHTPYRSPEKNGIVERFHLSLKTEAFKNIVPLSFSHASRICNEYRKYYNNFRPHQGIDGNIPAKTQNSEFSNKQNFSKIQHLGGKITSFEPEFLNVG